MECEIKQIVPFFQEAGVAFLAQSGSEFTELFVGMGPLRMRYVISHGVSNHHLLDKLLSEPWHPLPHPCATSVIYLTY